MPQRSAMAAKFFLREYSLLRRIPPKKPLPHTVELLPHTGNSLYRMSLQKLKGEETTKSGDHLKRKKYS
jgi:hypothetical protein